MCCRPSQCAPGRHRVHELWNLMESTSFYLSVCTYCIAMCVTVCCSGFLESNGVHFSSTATHTQAHCNTHSSTLQHNNRVRVLFPLHWSQVLGRVCVRVRARVPE